MKRTIYVGTDCRTCGRGPMVSRWGGETGIKHGTDGQCVTCYNVSRYHTRFPSARRYGQPGLAEANYEQNKAGLASYIADRRRRGIPPEGTGYIRLAGKGAA